jgi:phospholipid transport system substrate-binding protein
LAGPTERLRDFFAAVNTVLADAETEDKPLERVARICRLVGEISAVNEAAAVALGREWQARSPMERDEFVALFAQLLERAYVGRLAGLGSVSNGVRIAYLGESVGGDEATVQTSLDARDGGKALVEYRMVSSQGLWRVRDLVLDGVSIVENYRAQFQRILRQVSYQDLVGKVKAKLSDESIIFARVEEWSASAREPSPTELVLIAPLDARTTDHDRQPPAVRATAPDAESLGARAVTPVRSREDGWSAGAATAREKSSSSATVKTPLTGRAGTAPARSAALAASYWGQVGAFRTAAAAGRLAKRLSEEVVVSSVSGRLMLVRVAPFTQRAQAVSKLRGLAAIGYRPFITESVPPPRVARRPPRLPKRMSEGT